MWQCEWKNKKRSGAQLGKSDAGRGADGHRPYQLHIYLSTFSFETFNFLTSILSTTYLSIFVSGLIQVVDRDTIEMLDNVIDSPVFIDALEKVPPVSQLVLGALSPSSTSLSSAGKIILRTSEMFKILAAVECVNSGRYLAKSQDILIFQKHPQMSQFRFLQL